MEQTRLGHDILEKVNVALRLEINARAASVFNFLSYKEFLKAIIYDDAAEKGIQTKIARAAGCQVAYLNQSLKGKPQLSEDHGFRIAEYLNMTSAQREYFLTLIRLEHSSDPKFKEHLHNKLATIKSGQFEATPSLAPKPESKLTREFSLHSFDLNHALIYTIAFSKKHRSLAMIAKTLGLNLKTVAKCSEELAMHGYVELNEDGITPKPNVEFPLQRFASNSNFHIQNRLLAVDSMRRNQTSQSFNYSSLFTMNADEFIRFKEKLSEFASSLSPKANYSECDELYAFCLDAFRVNQT